MHRGFLPAERSYSFSATTRSLSLLLWIGC